MKKGWSSATKIMTGVLGLAILVLGVFIMVRAKGPAGSEEETVTVGAILPLTGEAATYGRSCRSGMKIAASRAPLRVIFEDSAADPKVAVAAFQKLQSVDGAGIILGDMFSAPTLAFAPIAQSRKVVVISPTSGAEAVPRTGSFIFSLYPTARLEGKFMAKHLSRLLPEGGTAGVLASQEEVYRDLADGFSEQLASVARWDVGFTDLLPPDTRDFKNAAAQLVQRDHEGKLDAVFLAGSKTFVANLIKQARQLRYSGVFLSQSTLVDPSLTEDFGSFLEGVRFSGPFFQADAKTEPTMTFVANYKALYGDEPDVWAAYCYDTMSVASAALENCHSCEGGELASAVAELALEGTTGSLSFEGDGVAVRPFRVYTFRNGALVAAQ